MPPATVAATFAAAIPDNVPSALRRGARIEAEHGKMMASAVTHLAVVVLDGLVWGSRQRRLRWVRGGG